MKVSIQNYTKGYQNLVFKDNNDNKITSGINIFNTNNCKLTIIENLSFIYSFNNAYNTDELLKERFETIFKKCAITIHTNIIDKKLRDYILNNFELYSYEEIPIGYNNGMQYHFLIKNPYIFNQYEKRFVDKNKKNIKTTIEKVFKKYRRKKDGIIDEILNII